MKFSPEMPEIELQSLCNDYLRKRGIEFLHLERGRTVSKAHKKGIPDLIIFQRGKVTFIELKTESGRLKPDQILFKDCMVALGYDYHVIRPSTFESFCTIFSK